MHKSTKWIIGIIIFGVVAQIIHSFLNLPMFLPYEWHKVLHIFGATLLLGNLIVTGLWVFWAEKTRDIKIIRFGALAINWADVFCTAPGTILLLINGMSMSNRWGGFLSTRWILLALVLFSLSGIIWTVLLLPLQESMIKLTANANTVSDEFYKKLRSWYIWGITASLLPLASMALMVLKP